MSWDIFLFSTKQKIQSIEEMDEEQFTLTNFSSILESHFDHIVKDDNHRSIIGEDYTIDFFLDDEEVSNKMLSLYGENGLYELVVLARRYDWQIFDTGIGEMIDLENPSKNGYESFRDYVKKILK